MIDFLTNALSVYHASDYIIKKLNETGGFTELKTDEEIGRASCRERV